MEQHTGSKLGKKYVKAIYCHRAYLTYMQSTSWEMPGWMNHKLMHKHKPTLSKFQEWVMDREAGVLKSMGSQRVGHNWATELNWTEPMTKQLERNNEDQKLIKYQLNL